MKEIKVLLNNVATIKQFVDIVCKFDMDVDIVYGRYLIDAKSIMGIFSIDTSHPVIVRFHSDNEKVLKNAIEMINTLGVIID